MTVRVIFLSINSNNELQRGRGKKEAQRNSSLLFHAQRFKKVIKNSFKRHSPPWTRFHALRNIEIAFNRSRERFASVTDLDLSRCIIISREVKKKNRDTTINSAHRLAGDWIDRCRFFPPAEKSDRGEGKKEREKNLAAITPLNFPRWGEQLSQTLLFENWIRTSVNGGGGGLFRSRFNGKYTVRRETAERRLRGEAAYSRLRHCETPSADHQPQLRDTTDVDQAGTPFRSAFPDTISIGILSLPFPSTDGRCCSNRTWFLSPLPL